ncbi:MAG: imidazole glycerol phosphate synthase subunit HisH [Asgard group archaeon]|nr:imidazole glycerol phosphate synthase subunit HisH [Asgard group archaeon]
MITIIDFGGSGNLRSVQKIFQEFQMKSIISDKEDDINNATALVLPGVGSFGNAMNSLEERGFQKILQKEIQQKPTLCICLGMQLLFEKSEETPEIQGLKIIKGQVRKLPSKKNIRIPHTGWNKIQPLRKPYFTGYGYFNHSYFCQPVSDVIIINYTLHGVRIPATILYRKILATQFHPEKSQKTGLQIIRYWIKSIINQEEVEK